MRRRGVIQSLGTLAVVALVASPAAITVAGQAPASDAKAKAPARAAAQPKTAWGEPDLQGLWSNRTVTPFERPTELAGKEVLSDEEAAEFEKKTVAGRNVDVRTQTGTDADVGRAYNEFWWDRGTKVTTHRTSLVIDPPDGKVPALTPEAQSRARDESKQPEFRGAGANGRGSDSYTDRSLFERCITRGMPGAMSPSAYNNNYQIIQSPGYVAIVIEMLGGVRIIPTDGRAHISADIRQWMGDSVGHWEGATLVVDTTNFTDHTLYRGAGGNLHLTERFTRVDANNIDYRFTVDDPTTFTRPWTVAVPYVHTGEPLYDYACHEGNYGMFGILSAGRAQDKAAADAAKKGSR
jgi:hypothetical protein